jgi:transposase
MDEHHQDRSAGKRDGADRTVTLLERAADVFASAADRHSEPGAVPLKDLHAKIGQQALEIGFFSGALGRLPGPSAER